MTRVVVTGLGLICDAGNTVAECWDNLTAGRTGIRTNTLFDTAGMPTDQVGQSDLVTPKGTDRCYALGEVAFAEALQDAALDPQQLGERAGLIVGSSLGAMPSLQDFHRAFVTKGRDKAPNAIVATSVLHGVADDLAAKFGVTGPRSVTSNACAASAVAIGYAAELLWSGEVDAVVCGGVDPLVSLSAYGFSSLGALAGGPCSPLSGSDGLTLGEGAAFLVLETEESAIARGARVYAEISGYGLTCDGYHQTAPDPSGDGAVRSMSEALRSGGLAPADVDYINMHGTGTPTNDAVEPKAVKLLLGSDPTPPVSSTKSMTGHTLGAAGAVEAICSVLAIHHNVLPPTTNVRPPAKDHGLDIVPERHREQDTSVVLSNSFAFGGNNASLVVTAPGRSSPPARTTRDVLVTGIAAVSAGAATTDEVLDSLRRGAPTFGRLDDERLGPVAFGRADTASMARRLNPAKARRMDAMSILSATATGDLYRRIGKPSRAVATGTGVVFGTGFGPLSTVAGFHDGLIRDGVAGANALVFPNTVVNAAAGHLAMLHRFRGYAATVTSGGTSVLDCLHLATRVIERGAADRLLVVVADEFPDIAMPVHAALQGYARDGEVRVGGDTGLVLADGAVAILLETPEASAESGTTPLAALTGFAPLSDVSGPGRLDTSGEPWARSMELALHRAGATVSDLDLVVAAGNGCDVVDGTEQLAMKASGVNAVPTIAPKETVGETYGSAAGFGILAALDSFARGDASTALVSSFAYGASYHTAVLRAA